jgi:hypothetical protein
LLPFLWRGKPENEKLERIRRIVAKSERKTAPFFAPRLRRDFARGRAGARGGRRCASASAQAWRSFETDGEDEKGDEALAIYIVASRLVSRSKCLVEMS